VKVLIDGRTLPPGARARLAAAGLALRGHDVRWLGAAAPPHAILVHTAGGLALARTPADVVVAGDRAPLGAITSAWLAGAGAAVFDASPGRLARWNALERWAWGSLYSTALIDPRDAATAQAGGAHVPLERLGLWPDDPPMTEVEAGHPDVEILERACERAFQRRRGRAPRPAAFLDRDGTLVIERGYLADPADITLLPATAAALRDFAAAGWALVVISNQSGVGRGLFTLETVYAAMARLRRVLRGEGVELDGIYFCPHRPEAGCDCRKPGIGLITRAAEDLQLDVPTSVMIGDKLLDVETARNAGMAGVLVRTGYGREEEQRLAGGEGPTPDAIADDLGRAAAWTLERAERRAGP
jgi:D-glycero-D-manno-heptose 1,7-bisphosphate phosphatase